MNIFAVIILAALVIDFTLKLMGNLLNLKALKFDVPSELEVYTNQKSTVSLRNTSVPTLGLIWWKVASPWQSC